MDPTPDDRLRRGAEAAAEGHYKEALGDYIWCHEHALEYQPSWGGVRRSFALHLWVDMAKSYPPAQQSLDDICQKKSARLLRGECDIELFRDVAAINRCLKRGTATHDLFDKLEQSNPDFANRCAPAAMTAIVSSGDFEMARRHIPSPSEAIKKYSAQLNEKVAQLEQRRPSVPRALDAHIRICSKHIALELRVVRGANEAAEADQLQALAVASIQSPVVRQAMQETLQSTA